MKGIQESDTEWIVFIDDDIVVPSDFITKMERFMDDDTGAIWSPCINVVEPFHTDFLAILERKFERISTLCILRTGVAPTPL